MRSSLSLVAVSLAAAVAATGCSRHAANVVTIKPGPDAQKQAQTAMINAKPGTIIEFAEGKFDFNSTLSLEDVNDVTIRGKGRDKTILSFKEQQQGTGGEGLRITSKENVTLEDIAVEDCKGDAVKAQGTDKLICRNVRVEWTGGPKETNGAYGLYPVMCTNVLIENCLVIGASDAGIYVGQSKNIIVRRNTAEKNVAGIEIENSENADVYENTATDNAGGILVFSLPDLPKKDGRNCRVFNNTVIANNHENFAPKGNIVASVPPGTGVMIMANDQVEVFDNKIENNQSAGVAIVSYLINSLPIKDEKYDPYCEAIFVYSNKFTGNGESPAGPLGKILSGLLGTPVPDILYDGIVDEKKLVDGKLPVEMAIRIRDNGDADFANFDAPSLTPANILANKKPNVVRDLKQYEGDLPKLSPVSIAGVK
ncbi:MAG: right-handed parallel beta-helix repeat-containing protein [Planctomycetia bacterium]|nr:right-handed parallel beta-helix repeat-containing protein [Planctomycetia bacterium]